MRTGRELADTVAEALGGKVRELPTEGGAAYVVVSADGSVPVAVRDFGHVVHALVGAGKAIALRPDEIDAALPRILGARAAQDPTVFEIALRVADVLGAAFDERFKLDIPGTLEPREIWLHAEDRAAASIGVFPGRAICWVAGECRRFAVDDLESVVAAVREQRARYRDNAALGERVITVATDLARLLEPRLGAKLDVQRWGLTNHSRVLEARVVEPDPLRYLVELSGRAGAVHVHAGPPGSAGFDGITADAASVVDAVAAAIERSKHVLTFDRLQQGQRYRVLEDLQGLRRGQVVTFLCFDDIDNHYGRCEFETDSGKRVRVAGDYSSDRNNPLAEAYRYLELL